MTSLSALLLVAVLPALFTTALGVCDYSACLAKIDLTGTDQQFCDGGRGALSCAETTLVNNPDCTEMKPIIDRTVARVKKIVSCYGCGGATGLVSSLSLSLGLSGVAYFIKTYS